MHIVSQHIMVQYLVILFRLVDIENIIELNPNLLSEYKKDKISELDLKFRIDDYAIINLEMQCENYSELWNRFQYYNG